MKYPIQKVIKLILSIILIAIIARLAGTFIDYTNSRQKCLRFASMGRLAAYINLVQNRERDTNFENIKESYKALLDQPEVSEFDNIQYFEIPSSTEADQLKGVTYYLFDPIEQVGMLSNGYIFRDDFDCKIIGTTYIEQRSYR